MDLETHNLIEPKVLIADDEYPNRLLIGTILGNAGISTVCVSNGIEALEQIEKQEFALVILDIQMPEMDGFQLLKIKTAFLNNLSHEIRTPLNAIVCCPDIISMPGTDRATHVELSEQIRKSTRYLLNLVDNIINISKLESGNTTIETKPTDLVFLLKFIFDYNNAILARDENKRQNIKLLFDNQIHEHSLKVSSDENFLRQIVSLLIENAVKFTEHGTVSLSANIEKDADKQELLRIEVKDTGIGISQEDQKIIFKKFRKAAHLGQKIYDGAGIGLAIIKKQIGMLNGTIQLESKLGIGSKFTVKIPITQC